MRTKPIQNDVIENFWTGVIPENRNGVKSYFYKLNITYGFILGVIVDQIIPMTGGLPIKLLKRFGKSIYSRSIKMNKFTNNWFIRGFLE